jgi:glycosyltransferase involved in cell wall biosynthesis
VSDAESLRTGRIAYCTVPKIGGTFNYFRNLRKGLRPFGWQVLAPTVGKKLNTLWDDAFADEDCQRVAADVTDQRTQAEGLAAWLVEQQIDFLIPMSTPAAVSVIPHLPPSVTPIYRCSNITRHAYDIVTEHLDYVPRVIATSQRQYEDLSRSRHVPPTKLVLISHGTDTAAFTATFESRDWGDGQVSSTGPIRLGYLGRLLDSAKGVMLLPPIIESLDRRRVEYTLTIIGDGPDRDRLARQFGDNPRIRWLGNQPNERIPGLLGEIDLLLMPSRFEGFGFSLIEAMASGAVPVVSRIRGVTDWIVEDNLTGYVCPIGDATEFADRIARLADDRSLLASIGKEAHRQGVERFSVERLGRDYNRCLSDCKQSTGPRKEPAPWSTYRPARGFEPTFRQWIPESWKGRLRGWLERWGLRA